MKKVKEKNLRNEHCEHHSNLALLTTVMAMACFVVLLFINMATHNPLGAIRPWEIAQIACVIYWVAAALVAYNAVRKGKKYLAEYVALFVFFGLGLYLMYNRPAFMRALVEGTYFQGNWGKGIEVMWSAILVVYSVVSIAWHVILATPVRKKRK